MHCPPCEESILPMPRDVFMLAEVHPRDMANHRFGVVVRGASAGFYRVQLTDLSRPDQDSPTGHGEVIKELLTNKTVVMGLMIKFLAVSHDPLKCCELLEAQYPIQGPMGLPILDEKQWQRVERRS